jgi:hypothetical protein
VAALATKGKQNKFITLTTGGQRLKDLHWEWGEVCGPQQAPVLAGSAGESRKQELFSPAKVPTQRQERDHQDPSPVVVAGKLLLPRRVDAQSGKQHVIHCQVSSLWNFFFYFIAEALTIYARVFVSSTLYRASQMFASKGFESIKGNALPSSQKVDKTEKNMTDTNNLAYLVEASATKKKKVLRPWNQVDQVTVNSGHVWAWQNQMQLNESTTSGGQFKQWAGANDVINLIYFITRGGTK